MNSISEIWQALSNNLITEVLKKIKRLIFMALCGILERRGMIRKLFNGKARTGEEILEDIKLRVELFYTVS
ncbi:hypothetical protein HanRHA438_Chr06g0263591 [Helianthus annuus]|nr:hypothetical protein HanRHA438_Chr06g0263591 [Helianthus annuus]